MTSYQHDWERTNTYGYAYTCVCKICKKTKMVSWSPGWPGTTEYYDTEGSTIKVPDYTAPPCTANPVDGLFKP